MIANVDFCVFGLNVICFHDSYSSFYMITTRRLGFENDIVQYQVKFNSSSSLSRVRVRAQVEFEFCIFEFDSNFIFQALKFSSSSRAHLNSSSTRTISLPIYIYIYIYIIETVLSATALFQCHKMRLFSPITSQIRYKEVLGPLI